jgi:hypothetical protein
MLSIVHQRLDHQLSDLNPIATMQVVCGATQKSLYDEWVCHDGYADMGPTTSGYADIGHTDGGQLIKNSFIF